VTGRLHVGRTFLALDRDNIVIAAELDNTKGQEPIESLEVSLWSHCTFRAPGIGSMDENVPEGTFFMKQTIPPGTKGRIAGTIPLTRHLSPSLVTWSITCGYSICVELNIPRASDPKHTFPITLVQSVDETGVLPRVSWTSNPYTSIPDTKPVGCYYSLPARPCVEPKLIPLDAPSGAVLWNPRLDPRVRLPSVGWVLHVASELKLETDRSIKWTEGVPQVEAKTAPVVTEPLPVAQSVERRGSTRQPSSRNPATSVHRPTSRTPLLVPGSSTDSSGGTCTACGDEAMEPRSHLHEENEAK
jgi:hypothetical protein